MATRPPHPTPPHLTPPPRPPQVNRELNAAESSLIGAFAGGFTGIVTTPLDVLKTRLMTQGASGRYKNLVDATIQIARQEGMGAFMSGWQPRLMWISLGGFVFFPVLEAAKKFYAPKMEVEPLKA
jgi:solute carrier family 25 S-adenosylmethionine transporter 26